MTTYDVTLAAQGSAAHGPVMLLFSDKVIFSTKALENESILKYRVPYFLK